MTPSNLQSALSWLQATYKAHYHDSKQPTKYIIMTPSNLQSTLSCLQAYNALCRLLGVMIMHFVGCLESWQCTLYVAWSHDNVLCRLFGVMIMYFAGCLKVHYHDSKQPTKCIIMTPSNLQSTLSWLQATCKVHYHDSKQPTKCIIMTPNNLQSTLPWLTLYVAWSHDNVLCRLLGVMIMYFVDCLESW
jgi:hypothetical protein